MKFTETRENDSKAKKKKQSKPKKKKFDWKATVVHGSDYVKDKAKKTKEEVQKLRIATFANTSAMWRPYALLIANYFSEEFNNNFNYVFDKLKTFNSKAKLSKQDIKEVEILSSLNELRYYVKNNEKEKEISINEDLINRDFFISDLTHKDYEKMIEESDKEYKHSIAYLLTLYNLLISFVKEKETKEVLYKAVIMREEKEIKQDGHPVILSEALVKELPTHRYLSDKYKKKVTYKYDN